MKFKNLLIVGTAVLASCLLSATAMARPGGGGGSCSVTEVSPFGSSTTFFVPSGGSGTYAILGWGNGTGGTVGSYDGMLEAAAEQCVLVAAAETSSSGNGRDVRDAINEAKSRYASIVGSNPIVCTSGHSQGGGGSFNAANLVDADCVIAVQPDTVFTTRIDRPVSRSTDVVCIFTSGDTLAPAFPSNGANCRRNSPGTYIQESGSGTHFAPNSGTGGDPGRFQREYINLWMVD
ncbi:hypothetical protein NBRC116493_17480 [Aurantivibrio infirmus]